MSRASRARAVASAAAVGGAGLVGVGSAVYGLLLAQTALARWRIGLPSADPLDADGAYRPTTSPDVDLVAADPVSLVVLGDSAAAGFGVERPDQTTAAVVAAALADRLGREVSVRSVAVVGAQSGDLVDQIERIADSPPVPHLALIVIGANDVTHRVPPGRSVAMLTHAIELLQARGIGVVVGTCPDLGTVRPIPHPLRWVARRWSRSLAAAQMVATVEAGARAVALADLLGPEFDAHPDRMFGPDRFHPSPEGYRALAEAMVPSLADALSGPPTPDSGTTSLDLAQAAAQAAEVGGAEVAVDSRSRLRGLLRLGRGQAGRPAQPPPADDSEVAEP